VHFPGLVVEHLLFYSFRNQHEKPLFRMGYITFSRTYFCCGLPPIARGPGPGPGPMGWPCRPNWTHGTRAPWIPWDHVGPKRSMDSIDLLGPNAPNAIYSGVRLRNLPQISHEAHGTFPRKAATTKSRNWQPGFYK
jgi:hypothetical protein